MRMALAVQGRTASRGPRDDTGATAPRWHLFDDLFGKRYDESILDGTPRGVVSGRMPRWARLAAEVHRRRDEYDAVVTWSERVSLAMMMLDRVSPSGRPHIPMLYWFSRPSVRVPMRTLGNRLQGVVTWSSVQRRYAIERLRIAPGKLYLVKHFVDDKFWSPRGDAGDPKLAPAGAGDPKLAPAGAGDPTFAPAGAGDMICSAGAEMRDYPTLLEALRGTSLRCHVATDHVRVDRFGFGRRVSAHAFAGAAGENVTIGRLPLTELRDRYARSRFVVVPLRRTDTDNGVNVILEAMAMGKPVICSRTQGQVDVIEEGVTGLFVPVGDARALRDAMLSLWNQPERAKAMGGAAREYVVKHHALDKFCRDVKSAIDAAIAGRPARADGSIPDG